MKPTRERILLAIFVLAFPLVAYISTLPAGRFRNEITEWGNQRSPAYQQYDQFRKQFGVEEYVIVSWPGCDLDDPRVEQVTAAIETDLSESAERVSSGPRLVSELCDRAKLSEKAALKRLRGILIGDDGSQTAVGFNLSQQGRENRAQVVKQFRDILRESGVSPEQAYFAGLGHNLYTLDKEGLESPFRMVPQIMLLAFLLTFLFVRNLWLAFFINALGTFTGCLSFNFIELMGIDMNAIIWPLPTLTMLLTVSAALHFLRYFAQATEDFQSSNRVDLANANAPENETSSGSEHPFDLTQQRLIAGNALRSATIPVACCTLTTAVGLLSLLLSTSQPVRQFGFFGCISVVAANSLLLLLMPPALTLMGQANRLARSQANDTRSHYLWSLWARFTRLFRWPIIIASLLLLGVLATGVGKIQTGSNLKNFFPTGHQVLKDTSRIETAAGPLNSVELLLQFENPARANDRKRIQALAAFSSRIESETLIKSGVCAATFAPTWKKNPNAIQKAAEKTRLNVLKKKLLETGFLHTNPTNSQETWRISCRYSTLQKIDLISLSETLETMAHETFSKQGSSLLPGEKMKVVATGEFVLFDYIDRQFFRELLITYVSAFVLITLIVLIVLRSPWSMLIALVPNLFPAAVVLGATGHLGFRLDVASLMTASVALGIAVDDTLHFLLWQKKAGREVSQSPATDTGSIENTLRHCGAAILQTSVILGSSIVLYAFCGFLPTVRFGILLSMMLFAALIGDLLLLPALAAVKVSDRSKLDERSSVLH